MRRTTWIVRVDLQHQVPGHRGVARRQDGDVAPRGVESVGDGAVPGAGAEGEDLEVMAVEMLRDDV